MAEFLVAGGAYLNLDGSRQAIVPAYGYVNDRTTTVETTFFRPTADVSAGSWTTSSFGVDLYTMLNETNYDDGSYCQSSANPVNDAMKVRFSAPGTRPVNTNHVIRYRILSQGGVAITVRLMQGANVRKTWTHDPGPTTMTTFEQTLTEGEAATLTSGDPVDLEIEAG